MTIDQISIIGVLPLTCHSTPAGPLLRSGLRSGDRMLEKIAVRALLAAAVLVPAMNGALAQDYPSRPITLMVGLAAGGITDVTARLYADAASKIIGQRITVENR